MRFRLIVVAAAAAMLGLSAGDAVGAAVAIGLVSLGLILVLGRWLPRVRSERSPCSALSWFRR